jgi:hypothetical protein
VFGDPTQPEGFLAVGTYVAERPEVASANVIDTIRREQRSSAPLSGVTVMELTEEMVRGMLSVFEQSAAEGKTEAAKVVSLVAGPPPSGT